MELVTEPDVYSPNIDENGNYSDRTPSFNTNALANGLRCPCGTRKDKAYTTASSFAAHCKSKTHQTWIEDLNKNIESSNVELLTYKNMLNKALEDVAQHNSNNIIIIIII